MAKDHKQRMMTRTKPGVGQGMCKERAAKISNSPNLHLKKGEEHSHGKRKSN